MSTPSEIALEYANNVLDGGIPAGRYVRLACQRFLNDLERAGTEEFPYVYDDEKGDRICKFLQLLPHSKGKWASSGERLILEPWQIFIECNVFGWVHAETGLRRFREAYEEEPRKNGKSIRMAGRGLYMLVADGEPGAEVYSGATTEKQAYEVFRPAWQMVNMTPALKERFSIEQSGTVKNPGSLYVIKDMSRFETIIGKPGDGASPHCAIVDEYHEHDTDHMVDTMQTGMGAREQPLLCIITTAGSNLGGPCYAKRQEVMRILDGSVKAENVFGIIYGIDEDDDWSDPASLIKANPNYGVSVFPEFLLAQLEQAKRSPTKQSAFRTKHLNQWVGARSAWMNMLSWQKQRRDFTLESMGDAPCWIGVDLASKKDVAALVILFRKDNKYFVFPKFYSPESSAEENANYLGYAAAGDMILTPGNMTDYQFIEEDILDLASRLNLVDVAFDDWQANYLITRLTNSSVKVVNYNQTVRNMSDPMKEIEAQVIAGNLHHNGNSVMTWMMGNVAARVDAKENVYPRRENENDPKCKIDGPVALIMAMGRSLVHGKVAGPEYSMVIL